MGKILQIRVSAWTYDEGELERAWPRLADLAFSVPLKRNRQGVLEMIEALDDGLRFMDWPEACKASLKPHLEHISSLKARLEGALADWDPRRANSLSDEIEDALDLAERSCKLP